MNTSRATNIAKNSIKLRIIISLIGIIVNVLLGYIVNRLGLPLFLDTFGTIAVSALAGLFPGIFTAVITNAFCALYDVNAIYFGFINALVAVMTAWFARKYTFKKFWKILVFILFMAVFVGGVSSCIHWFLLDASRTAQDSQAILLFASTAGLPLFWAYFAYNILVNILDKGIAVLLTAILLAVMPERLLKALEYGSWKQRPLRKDEIDTLNAWGKDMRHSMRFRTTLVIIVTSILLVIVTGWSGIRQYFAVTKESKTVDAQNALELIVKLVDPEDFRSLWENGASDPKYEKTEDLLQTIVDNYSSVESLYIIRFYEKEGRVLYDLGSSGKDHIKKNVTAMYDEKIMPFIPYLTAGEYIDPIEHGDINSWVRSVFRPIYDSEGKCVCYAVADVSVTYMADYMEDFIIRSIIILLGFFILVLGNNMWYTNMLMVYPIRSMAKCVDDFSNLGYEQEQLDKNVKNIRSLEINTEDEVEKLYKSICRMTLNLSEQMRDLRRLSEATAKMQDGLIITMADMVERRDSDTGEHIQKTALYVKIIVEGLKKKGYYAEKITPKFMSDVVRSAPLHDIGKINIPDEILNKPGKLTPEEFEIMKTHATAGKKIMEDAISTVQGENYLKEARNMAAYHHERWDGKGYPEGLHGEVIPLSARIMAVADVFDALTSPRVYKEAFPLDKALSIIKEEAGKQFDPRCVEVFMDSLPEVKVILKKYNNM